MSPFMDEVFWYEGFCPKPEMHDRAKNGTFRLRLAPT
jgi:hypothetical protein